MSKSAKATSAKPFNQEKVYKSNTRKLNKTLEVKIERENELDPNFTTRNDLLNALLTNVAYKRSEDYKGGTIKLHRAGMHSSVEYFNGGKFSHVIETFATEEEANKLIDKIINA